MLILAFLTVTTYACAVCGFVDTISRHVFLLGTDGILSCITVVKNSKPFMMMADSFCYTLAGSKCASCTYKGLKTAMYGKHVIKTSCLTPQLVLLVSGYNAETDVHTPGDDFVLGACFELHHDIEVALMAVGAIHDPTVKTFDHATVPPTAADVWEIINLIAADNQCYDQLALATDMYFSFLQSPTADIEFDVGNQQYAGQLMSFGFGGCAVPIPRLSTNPWWVVRVMDTAPFKDSVDASSRAHARVAALFNAIIQIPFGFR